MNKTWYFTFGMGHKNAGKVQPIVAQTPVQARDEMVKRYGLKWSMQYSQMQWERLKAEVEEHGQWKIEEEMEPIVLTGVGEVQKCT